MKKFVIFLGAMLICGVATAQEKIDFYKFIESIDWNSTREQFVEKHRDMIVPDSVTDKSKSRLKEIYFGPIASSEVVVNFDTLTTKLKNVKIYYHSNLEPKSEYAKRWTAQFDQSLQENLGEPYKTAFDNYYFHTSYTIDDFLCFEGASNKWLYITPPVPENEKDFRVANWGDSKEKIRSLEGRLNESRDRDLYYFEDSLGELKCTVVYKFANDKLIWAKYLFEDIEDNLAIYHYERFEKMLDKKYGTIRVDATRWENDKYAEKYKNNEIEAIKKGYRHRYKFWCNGATEIFLGITKSDQSKNGWYLAIEYHGRIMKKVQDQAVYDAL